MPTYEYECLKCGKRFEQFQSIHDPPRRRCPECRGKVRRLVGSGAGVIFKGSGFYVTDYRSESYKERKRKESGEAPKSGEVQKSKDEPKSKTGPRPKPEQKSGAAGASGRSA
jgi:putative FmdB family regulatory protein